MSFPPRTPMGMPQMAPGMMSAGYTFTPMAGMGKWTNLRNTYKCDCTLMTIAKPRDEDTKQELFNIKMHSHLKIGVVRYMVNRSSTRTFTLDYTSNDV